MKSRNFIAGAVAIGLVVSLIGPATAGKKKPKPYSSDEGQIAVAHTMLFSSTGEVNSVTAKEFENTCSIPVSNGLDAYVYEVPAAYQKIQANIEAIGRSSIGHDLYIFFYDKDCVRNPVAVSAASAVGEQSDASGIMPAGTAYVLIASFAGDPVTIHYELKP